MSDNAHYNERYRSLQGRVIEIAETESDDDFADYERWLARYSFVRTVVRRALRKRLCDCGHVIDGSEPYRYAVWRRNYDDRGVIHQRTDCEFCARADSRY